MTGSPVTHQNVSQGYKKHLENYLEWLERLGYAAATIYRHSKYLGYFFNWLSANETQQLHQVKDHHIAQYQNYLETRTQQRKPAGLSAAIIYAYMHVLKSFDK